MFVCRGTALCGLKNNIRDTNLEEEFNDVKANESLGSELSDDNSSHSIPVVSASKVKAAKLHPAKRRKIDKPIVLPANDVRLSYGEEYLHAINSSDASVYEAMLRRIAIPKVVMVSRKNIPDPSHLVPTHMEVF